MKNLKILSLLLIGIFVLQSCGNKDEVTEEKSNIVGIWSVDNFDFDISVNGLDFTLFFESEEQVNFYKTFLLATFQEFYEGLTYEIKSDNTYIASYTGAEGKTIGSWSISSTENTLTLDAGTEIEMNYNIITSSDESLTLQYVEVNNLFDLNSDGINEEIKVTIDLTLTK